MQLLVKLCTRLCGRLYSELSTFNQAYLRMQQQAEGRKQEANALGCIVVLLQSDTPLL